MNKRHFADLILMMLLCLTPLSAIFQLWSRSTRREPPTMGKQLVNFITCGCESSTPLFCNLQSRARTHAVLVIGLYEYYITHWATRALKL